MRSAARDARMFGQDYHQFRIVLEPEAASLICREEEPTIQMLKPGFSSLF